MKRLDFSTWNRNSKTETHWLYNGLDCIVTHRIASAMQAELDDLGLRAYYDYIHQKQAVFLEMGLRGLLVDEVAVRQLVQDLRQRERAYRRIFDRLCKGAFGETFNPNSSKALQRLFYHILGLKPVMVNRGGSWQPGMDRNALETLARRHAFVRPLVRCILGIRDCTKALGFLATKRDADLRLRTAYNVAGTVTGRLSSSQTPWRTGTNLQNVARGLRKIIRATPGWLLVNVDLEQADARNVGARVWTLMTERGASPEAAGAFLDLCESGDLHTSVCRMVWPELDWGDDPAGWRAVAEQPFYRDRSYRDIAKILGHGCLTADHEVLTPEGWRPISEKPPVIMQWQDGRSEFVQVQAWHEHDYTGLLHIFEGRSLSACMTPDHRVPFKKDRQSRTVHEAPAAAGPQGLIPLGGDFIGGPLTGYGRLMAAVMSDGEHTGKRTRFNLRKERKRERLVALCEDAGIPYTVHPDSRISIAFQCPKKAGPWLLQYDRQTLLDLLDEYKFWDGHRASTSTTLFSVDLEHLEWLQTIGRLLGIGGNISKPYRSGSGSIVYRLQQNRRKWAVSIRHSSRPAINEPVFCPTVPSSFFYIRHNGKISVTGNSNYRGTPRTMSRHSKLPEKVVADFQRRYFEQFPGIPLWHQWVAEQLQTTGVLTTLFGRRRRFFGDPKSPKVLNEAVAYEPQSMTGEEIDRGIMAVRERFSPDEVRLLAQVHDSVLLEIPEDRADELIPEILDTLRVTITLVGNRPFFVPLEAKVGRNWADADDNKNPEGLRKWRPGKA